MHIPIRLSINSPEGVIAFSAKHAKLPLPWGLDGEGPDLAYGPYLDALASFLAQNNYQPLQAALSAHLERVVSLPEIQSLEIISQKHGALYHVAQVCAKISGASCSLALNSAVRAAQQAFLESEFTLLQDLNERFPLSFTPRAYVQGESPYTADDGSHGMLKLFLAEWFEGYHEFHLSRRAVRDTLSIKVWDDDAAEAFLNSQETRSLYRQAAAILTAYFDPEAFSQIHPWHHAAGDFVLQRRHEELDLRLITVRGYQPLVSVGADPSDRWIPFVHFFLNLSLRMRLDRLDGVGDLAWASPDCVEGVVAGFLDAWQEKAERHSDLPPASEMLDVLRSFTPEEWLFLSDLVLEDGLTEAEEVQFLQPRLEEHMVSLFKVLRQQPV